MKLFLLAGAVALVLAACGGENAEKKTQDDRSIGAASQAERPEFGDWGVETVYISASAKPGDDFYRYVNAGWLDSFKIPDDFSSYGAFTVLFERSEERINKIIEDAASGASADGTSERKIGDYFASFNDVDAINAKGLETIAPDLAFIDALASHEDVARAMARPDIGANAPFAAFVDIDSKQPDRYITHITQAGLGMPNRTYYLEQKFADKQAKYKDYVAEILALAGVEDAASKAAAIYDVEYQIALAHWTPEKRRERDLAYNLKTLEELKAFAPEAPWEAMFDEAGIGGEREFVVREYDAIQKLAKIFAETPVDVWRDYLKFHLINSYADVLPAEVDDAHFAFYGATLQGVPKQRERWKRAVAAVNDAIGEAVGKIYVERYFPPSSKSQMEALVANLSAALSERLDMLAWMSEATKAQAHKKLDKFLAKIGYPDKWRDYSDLIVVRGDAYGNAKRAREFEWRYEAAKLGQPIDKTEWGMTPQTVNAYYSPPRNEIVFPAAILQAPFFDPNADAAVNYGGIGAVIGHEISHGFDDQGRKSNGDGKLEDWWSPEDAAAFSELAEKLGRQYAGYEPIPGFAIRPKLTMGENIGDLGGLATAYRAYKLSLKGEEAPVIDGFTGDQRFFLAYAQIWRRVVREEALKNQIETDPHSPAAFRVNGVVRNMDAWYEAFGVAPGDKLYLAPADRVQIW